jgi:hypothetical protein
VVCLAIFSILFYIQATRTTTETRVASKVIPGFSCSMLSKYTSPAAIEVPGTVFSVRFTDVMVTYEQCVAALSDLLPRSSFKCNSVTSYDPHNWIYPPSEDCAQAMKQRLLCPCTCSSGCPYLCYMIRLPWRPVKYQFNGAGGLGSVTISLTNGIEIESCKYKDDASFVEDPVAFLKRLLVPRSRLR